MPSFDVVSEIEQQELTNAIDQANREISTRFDFKGTDSKIDLNEWVLTIVSKSEFQIKQINDILKNKLNKRGIDIRCLEYEEIVENNNTYKIQNYLRYYVPYLVFLPPHFHLEIVNLFPHNIFLQMILLPHEQLANQSKR